MNKKEVSASLAGTVCLGGEVCVNRLGFGAMRLTGEGIWGPPRDRKKALAVLRRAVELDVNFVDTADSYGPNVSEELIAEALFPYPKELVIATKGGWDRPGPNQWTHDASPDHLRKAVEGSLKRLRLDRIDVYQLHTPDPVVSFDASVETLAELRNEGKIRLVGLSNVTREHVDRARKIVPIVSVQNRYSFADREWDYVVDYCERNGIVFIPWYPLAAGRVAGDVLNEIAKAYKASPKQVALAWLLGRSAVMLPIPGTSSTEHLQENVAAASVQLTPKEYATLAAVPQQAVVRKNQPYPERDKPRQGAVANTLNLFRNGTVGSSIGQVLLELEGVERENLNPPAGLRASHEWMRHASTIPEAGRQNPGSDKTPLSSASQDSTQPGDLEGVTSLETALARALQRLGAI